MRRAWTLLATFGALVLGAVLRAWGIGYAPFSPQARPDEEIFIRRAFDLWRAPMRSEILRTGWPEGYFRLDYFLQRLQSWFLETRWDHPVNLACVYAVNPGAVEIWSRVTSLLLDLITALLVGGMVRALARDDEERQVALPMGLLAFGCNYLAVRDAHFAVSDATVTLAVGLSLALALRAAEKGSGLFLALSAFVAGAGFGIKYAAAALVFPCACAGLFFLLRRRPGAVRALFWILLTIAAVLAGLFLVSPGTLLHPHDFLKGLESHSHRYHDQGARGYLVEPDAKLPPGFVFHLLTNLPVAFGIPGYLLAILGLALAIRRRPAAGWTLLLGALGGLAFIFDVRALFVRYASPMLPALCVGLGFVLTMVWTGARRRYRWGTLWAVGVILLALAPPVVRAVAFDRLMALPDTRDLAARWLQQPKHEGSSFSQGDYTQVDLLDPAMTSACRKVVPPWLWRVPPSLISQGERWEKAVAEGPKSYGHIGWSAQQGFNNADYSHRDRARYDLIGRPSLPCGARSRVNIAPPPYGCWNLVEVIAPGAPACGSLMDLFDAFYVPYDGFRGQQLPGPEISIYENHCRVGSP